MIKKQYTTKQIKAQEEKYKKASARYMKSVAKPSTRENKERAVELHYKAADEFEKLTKMKGEGLRYEVADKFKTRTKTKANKKK